MKRAKKLVKSNDQAPLETADWLRQPAPRGKASTSIPDESFHENGDDVLKAVRWQWAPERIQLFG